jgi:hypothetical protein
MFDPSFAELGFVLDLFSEVFARFPAVLPPMDLFLDAAFSIVAAHHGDSDLFWRAASALNTILESAPHLIVERTAANLPQMCAGAGDENSVIMLQMLALVARAINSLSFLRDPTVAAFVWRTFSEESDPFFTAAVFADAEDVSAAVECPAVIAAFSELLRTDQKVDLKMIAVRFLCRAVLCATPGARAGLLTQVDLPALLEFLSAGSLDEQRLILRAAAAALEAADRCPFDVAALAEIAQETEGEAAALAHCLLAAADEALRAGG